MNRQELSPSPRSGIFKADLPASIVVFFVALPLCMGVAIASGAPVAAGLISGIIGGLVVGALAGCPLQVSGPAAGLTVIVYETIQQLGIEMLGLVVLVAGILQIIAGVARWGQWFRAVSPAVIKGMLAGIGLLILAGQFHVMIDDKPKGSGSQNLLEIPAAIGKCFAPPSLGSLEFRKAQIAAARDVRELTSQQGKLRSRPQEQAVSSPHGAAAAHGGERAQPTPPAAPTGPERHSAAEAQSSLAERIQAVAEQLNHALTPTDRETHSALSEAAEAAVVASREAARTLHAPEDGSDAARIEAAYQALRTLDGRLRNHPLAGALSLATIVVIVLWEGFTPKRVRVIPAALVAVLFATATAAVFTLPIAYVDVPSNLWTDIRFPTLALFVGAPWALVLQKGALTAVVASAETLLSASAVDQMHRGPRTNYDRELFSQGVGNSLCGLVGALPVTGVIVRSSANVQAGAQSRAATMLHAVWLLIFVGGLTALLRWIPTGSLAAILVYTGYKLIDAKSMRLLLPFGWSEIAIYAATIGTIIFEDLLTGVLVGIGLSSLKLLYTFSHLEIDLQPHPEEPKSLVLHLAGAATFIRLPQLAAAIERVPAGVNLHVDFTHLDYIDHSCLDLLLNWGSSHQSSGGALIIDWESLHARFRREPRLQSAGDKAPPVR